MLFKDVSAEQLAATRRAIQDVDDERLRQELACLLSPSQSQAWADVEEVNPGYVGWWIKELSKELAARGIDPVDVAKSVGYL